MDRYEIGKPKYTVIDLEQQKIARTADLAPEDERATGGGRGGGFQISPDGKYLYQFRDSVVILNTADSLIPSPNLARTFPCSIPQTRLCTRVCSASGAST